MKIAFYRGFRGNWMDWLISILSLNKYSHCELIYDGWSYTSTMRDGNGVRKKKINFDPKKWDIFELPENEKEHLIIDFFEYSKNCKYDLWGILLRIGFGLPKRNFDKFYCSEWCCIILNRIYDTQIHPQVSPGDLYINLKRKNLKWQKEKDLQLNLKIMN